MKTLLRYVVMTLLALVISLPGLSSAEAGNILLMPVVNKAENTNPEIISQIYYQTAMDCIRDLPDYEMVNSDDMEAPKTLPTKEEMIALAKARRADIVVCFELDNLDYTTERHNGDSYVKLNLQGFCATYEAQTGKYKKNRILEEQVTEEDVTFRWDWTGEEWSKSVKREMNRIMKNKRVKIYAPKIGSLK